MVDPNKLFEENELLAYAVVHRMKLDIPAYEMEDQFQTARMGLWKAASTYDPARSKFSTWAVNCIRRELLMALRNAAKPHSTRVEVVSLDYLCEDQDNGLDPYYYMPRVESFEDSLVGLIDVEGLDLTSEERFMLDLKKYLTESEIERLCNSSKWTQRKTRMKARGQAE